MDMVERVARAMAKTATERTGFKTVGNVSQQEYVDMTWPLHAPYAQAAIEELRNYTPPMLAAGFWKGIQLESHDRPDEETVAAIYQTMLTAALHMPAGEGE